MIVVDASVAVKLLIPEAGSDQAHALLVQGEQLYAPSLVTIEVLGAVLRQFREKRLVEAEVAGARTKWLALLDDGLLRLVEFDACTEKAFALSMSSGHPLPDCIYLALGEQLQAQVITADRKMHERGKRAHSNVTLLDGFASH